MTTFLSFHEPGFWLVVSLLCTLALLAGQPFAPPAWRTPLAVANWVGIPYLALIAGGVSPRLMGLKLSELADGLSIGRRVGGDGPGNCLDRAAGARCRWHGGW